MAVRDLPRPLTEEHQYLLAIVERLDDVRDLLAELVARPSGGSGPGQPVPLREPIRDPEPAEPTPLREPAVDDPAPTAEPEQEPVPSRFLCDVPGCGTVARSPQGLASHRRSHR